MAHQEEESGGGAPVGDEQNGWSEEVLLAEGLLLDLFNGKEGDRSELSPAAEKRGNMGWWWWLTSKGND
jgi:hypothetical protein